MLLPSIRFMQIFRDVGFPENDGDVADPATWKAFVMAIQEQGAPCLEDVLFENPHIVSCLPTLQRLKKLALHDVGSEYADALEQCIAANQGRPFLQALEDMRIEIGIPVGADKFIRALSQVGCPILTSIGISLGDWEWGQSIGPAAGALGEVVAAGAFPLLTRLRLTHVDDGDLAALVPGLASGTCSLTLQTLELVRGGITGGPGLIALGSATQWGRGVFQL